MAGRTIWGDWWAVADRAMVAPYRHHVSSQIAMPQPTVTMLGADGPLLLAGRPPAGLSPVAGDVRFSARRHLAPGRPRRRIRLDEIGYSRRQAEGFPGPVALAGPFRLLSEEGVRTAGRIIRRLARERRLAPDLPSLIRGGVYRSRFLDGLCASPEVTAHVSHMLHCAVAPHPLLLNRAHTNLAPDDAALGRDRWHAGSVPFVIMLAIAEPADDHADDFQVWRGRVADGLARLAAGKPLTAGRRESTGLVRPGFAIAMQGPAILHWIRDISRVPGRITLVNCYVPADPAAVDRTELAGLQATDPDMLLLPEYARMTARQTARRLDQVADQIRAGQPAADLARTLAASRDGLDRAIAQLTKAKARGRKI